MAVEKDNWRRIYSTSYITINTIKAFKNLFNCGNKIVCERKLIKKTKQP